jgi:hypothetical protein
MVGPVMGVRVLRRAIGMIGARGAEEVEVDAVHGFRPIARSVWKMPEKLRYSDSGKSTGRKMNLRVILAEPALVVAVAGV